MVTEAIAGADMNAVAANAAARRCRLMNSPLASTEPEGPKLGYFESTAAGRLSPIPVSGMEISLGFFVAKIRADSTLVNVK
jgi:hypothetical protein